MLMVPSILMSECAVRKGLLVAAAVAIAGVSFWFLRRPPGAPAKPAAASAALPAPAAVPAKVLIPYGDAQSILEAHRDHLPAELKGKTASEQESAWPDWAAAHDAAIRARLAEGDEDSVVNLWLYGTTFTTLPRATDQQMGSLKTREAAEDGDQIGVAADAYPAVFFDRQSNGDTLFCYHLSAPVTTRADGSAQRHKGTKT
jgi:hypothetical protein